VVFPYGSAKKYRKGFEKADGRKFWWDPPTSAGQIPFLPPGFEPAERMIVVEGETDTMAAWQALPDELRGKVSIVGLSGTGSWAKAVRDKGGIEALFGPAKRVFVVFDRDDPYENPTGAESVERAWKEIRGDLGRKARRVVLPQGINDVAEFFERYDWAAFQVLLQRAAEPKRNYPRLDLTKPVPDTDWLVEDLLVRSEATVIAADGGVGKSWLMMALALSVAGGLPKFLGLPLKRHGPVLYVDEENSADLIHQRLNALAMGMFGKPLLELPDVLRNLEYLWYAGVDLFNEPERLLEEAQEIEPELIVADSLSRVALGVEENSNTEMSKLMRSGIIPLARDTGAAVAVVHHTSRDAKGGVRGATGIRNAADQVISVVKAKSGDVETGRLNIFPSKPRRRTAHIQAELEGDMETDGYVRVIGVREEVPF
jgi:hypothetical protein